MVRETRHLWVGNLPDNIREDRIREHFKRYGRVQNVKLLGRTENATIGVGSSGNSGICATVAFMDIKSASKAHNAEHVLDERTLTTEYYEPAAIPSAAGAPSAGSSPAGSGYSGSSSSVNSTPAPASVSRYHMTGGEDGTGNTCPLAASAAAPATWRGTNDSATEYCRRGNTPAAYGRYQRNNSTAPYATPPSNVERTTPHHRWYASGERATGATGGESTPSTPGGGTESGRRRRHSGSGSSRSESSSPEPSDTSRASTPAAQPPLALHANHRAPHTNQHQWAAATSGRTLAICVRNLPTRSTDSSLKDGLYHEYKKHGKVMWVKVVGQNADRYAVVRFKKPSDVEKALEVSQDKLFFGCKISVAPHQSCDEDADSAKPYETDIDEYHPKATRTLFIGNLEKDVTQQQLRDKFKHFGRIIEIDIKKGSGGGAGYAFCQYASISSVVEAIRAMDGEYVGGSRVKLGFGKPVATTCVWVDGLTEHTEKQVLGAVSRCGAATSVCVDRAAGAALVHFEQAAAAGAAVRELRRVAAAVSATEPDHPRLCVDYASRECQEAFYEQLEKHGGSAALAGSERLVGDVATRYLPSTRHESLRYENCGSRSRASSYGRGSSRTPRYSTVEHYDPTDYAADRRYRVYDEVGSSPQTEETTFEDRLQSVVVSPHRARRHRRDSSPEDRKHSKERHLRIGGRRSRSGSRGLVGERHSGRRRHRKRRDGSGSRAGTPLRDEPDAIDAPDATDSIDAPPAEPRRPPRDRPPLPMSLPLPKFAVQLLRSVPPTPRPQPAPAPDSPPRPPSATSSSTGSAPHSPSLEERIRSLDEKYEKWSGSRTSADAPDRTRLRHRLLDVDINEVKPSEVVRSLLAKRSVFDEDSERLEGAVRAPSPTGSPRSRSSCSTRGLRLSYSTHSPHLSLGHLGITSHSQNPNLNPTDLEADISDRPADPRLNRPERPIKFEKLGKFNESDYKLDTRIRPRTPSTDRSQPDSSGRLSPGTSRSHQDEYKEEVTRSQRDFFPSNSEPERKKSFDFDLKEYRGSIESVDIDFKNKISIDLDTSHCMKINNCENKVSLSLTVKTEKFQEDKQSDQPLIYPSEEKIAHDVIDLLLNRVEQRQDCIKIESKIDKPNDLTSDTISLLPGYHERTEKRCIVENDHELKIVCQSINDSEKNTEMLITNHVSKDISDSEMHQKHFNSINTIKINKESFEFTSDLVKPCDKNGKERYNHSILDVLHNTKLEKENIHFDKTFEKEKYVNNIKQHISVDKKNDNEKNDDCLKTDRDKLRHAKERFEKERHEYEKSKGRTEKISEKIEKKSKDEMCVERYTDKVDKIKTEKEEKSQKEKKDDRDTEINISKHFEEKISRYDQHRKEKTDKDKRKESIDETKLKKDDRHRPDRCKKDSDMKKENKKDSDFIKNRKSSRDETTKEIVRKDSTDSAASRTSHESVRLKDLDNSDAKEDIKFKLKPTDLFGNLDNDFLSKSVDIHCENTVKIKTECREDKEILEFHTKIKTETIDNNFKNKTDTSEKQRHYSLDSPNVESKRKERLNSCSSLPSNIGHKRRISSQDSLDSIIDDSKKSRNDNKPERRDSKDSKSIDRHKTAKFSKGHFAKIIESKTKDDRKNQVKPPDNAFVDHKESDAKHLEKIKSIRMISKDDDKMNDMPPEGLHKDLDFLATLELRSSEEDERQKALRKEMKEKKRIQQLQQIQELQMQQGALQQAELMIKNKDDKKLKCEDKKKEAAREKRLSTDRKSREEKSECSKRRNRKQVQTSDSSDSDEPKKHSIFDIIDDGPTYISMYDKVKARSCKNMQKQEEEKRQEKIKAKFSQLKQSRAKREEKKRSSWDEDSDSDSDKKKTRKSSMMNSSDEENIHMHKGQEKSHLTNSDCETKKSDEYFDVTSNEENLPNKLSRKNSRTRIMSDTSDDDTPKRSISKSPLFLNDIKKEPLSDSDSMYVNKNDDKFSDKESSDRKVKKNSLLNLFGKSDGDDSKTNCCNVDMSREYKSAFVKSLSNDFSSENESIVSSRNITDIRKKHKKKQKKHKFLYSDEESKGENRDLVSLDGDSKHKTLDKQRRHSNKKEKRKEKTRESIDTDDTRDDKAKFRKDKKSPNNNCFDFVSDTISSNLKKDGKMEDIFGPLSEDSDKETKIHMKHKCDFSSREYDSNCKNYNMETKINNSDTKLKDKEENRRRKEKKRKERRLFKEDDNSLDVDAVSKAIEARLFAESLTDEDNRLRIELPEGSDKNDHTETSFIDSNLISEFMKQEKMKKDCKEKKKKKKRSKEDRPTRKEHHFYNHDKIDRPDNIITDDSLSASPPKPTILDIPLPKESPTMPVVENGEDCKSLVESPSLPRLTDSPPTLNQTENSDTTNNESSSPTNNMNIDEMTIHIPGTIIDIQAIPMPPTQEILAKPIDNVNEIPLPPDNVPQTSSEYKVDLFKQFSSNISEDAVRSICNLENEVEKNVEKLPSEKNELKNSKLEKKVDEKPRAVISQEETEDAVAALLGESFGGKVDNFTNRYEEPETDCVNQNQIVNVNTETENIPEEDAEEMRQAVQNLNASEMEMKPDTPVSDSDLLLIDTDTEDIEETPQDAIERLPINIIATNQALTTSSDNSKPAEVNNIVVSKPKTTLVQTVLPGVSETITNVNDTEVKIQLAKRENSQTMTSAATPVITSWTLSNNKIIEPHVLNIQTNPIVNKDKNENKATHITANILQIKPQNQNVSMSNSLRPIMPPNRVTTPYQVINQMIRPPVSNIQPPTIKIPEPHILYQKQQGIVISPRIANDPRLLSPKNSPQGENMTSPRRTNVAILNTPPQNINSVGVPSPNTIQQRSPGQVTVVRMQQPPLSPIQTVHIPHGTRAMVSPNRPNSVLVQAQGSPIHFNRLPVTPVLAPISKQMHMNNIVQQNKNTSLNSPLNHQQKVITNEQRKNDQNFISEKIIESSKIILSPTNLQHSSNPTVMAQNRLISMQNAIHVTGLNSPAHVNNKVLINTANQINDKRENQPQKLEQLNHGPFCPTPIIHVAGGNHTTTSIIQSGTKPVVCNVQDTNSVSRGQGSNVIHTVNSQRLLTSTPLGNVIQKESNKGPPSVLSMASIKTPSVLTKVETSNAAVVTTNNITAVSQLLMKTSCPNEVSRYNIKNDKEFQHNLPPQNHTAQENDIKLELDLTRDTAAKHNVLDSTKSPLENFNKGETDFEELLKDNTNEIKLTNNPEKKLEVNVGKTVTLFKTTTSNYETGKSIDYPKNENEKEKSRDFTSLELSLSQQTTSNDKEDKNILNCETFKLTSEDNVGANTEIKSEEDNVSEKDIVLDNIDIKIPIIEEESTPNLVKFNKHDEIETSDVKANLLESTDNHIKSIEENDSWTAKDLNIESVIKKVDSLCNEPTNINDMNNEIGKETDKSISANTMISPVTGIVKETLPNKLSNNFAYDLLSDVVDKLLPATKRGGRNMRGKKLDKTQARVQTRQISKPLRGGASAKRGRGRAKVDKKIKNLVKNNANTIPGDVYDFHEDSGDESATSTNKVESRPRLILTIKSPLSGHTNMTATSTLSITPKDIKSSEKTNKEEKGEDFVLPSPSTINTRKSRRLQEKDIQRSTVDDVIDDVVKVVNANPKMVKEGKKRPTRQIGTKSSLQDKTLTIDTRKSPRGTKRTRDTSLSDASMDSGDEKIFRSEDCAIEPKVPRMQETTDIARDESMQSGPTRAPAVSVPASNSASTSASVSTPSLLTGTTPAVGQLQIPAPISTTPVIVSQSIASTVPTAPTPITKPPKKMISEISAKLASVFEAQQQVERAQAAPGGEGRERDSVPPALVPVGATEATDARVQSPALPHRPPSAPATPAPLRPADRATPVLVRSGEGDGVVGGGARAYRTYSGGASLPRGAHHPPAEPLAGHAAHAALATHATHATHATLAAGHAKQVAVVGPHPRPHHPGAPSRITIASVPSISPQSQMTIGDGVYPHFSHQHYQMYQQHFRATQHEHRATPSPYTRSLEAEGCEAPTPPLELRRPPSARVPRPAHSPRQPTADELRFSTTRVVVRSPPPAHGLAPAAAPAAPAVVSVVPAVSSLHGRHMAHVARLAGALPPAAAPGPPHASQVPREADSLQMLLRRYPVMWQGLLALKNDSAAVQMHFVGGNPNVAGDTLSRHGTTPLLRIAQRMRLEPQQLDQVHRKMKMEHEHCMLLALPCGRDHMDVLQQSTNLTAGFITYLQRKQAAGIVNIAPPGHQQAMFTVHIFPSCDFANENLTRIAPDLMHRVADIAHLLIVIATV